MLARTEYFWQISKIFCSICKVSLYFIFCQSKLFRCCWYQSVQLFLLIPLLCIRSTIIKNKLFSKNFRTVFVAIANHFEHTTHIIMNSENLFVPFEGLNKKNVMGIMKKKIKLIKKKGAVLKAEEEE